jgi:hypothetical protein
MTDANKRCYIRSCRYDDEDQQFSREVTVSIYCTTNSEEQVQHLLRLPTILNCAIFLLLFINVFLILHAHIKIVINFLSYIRQKYGRNIVTRIGFFRSRRAANHIFSHSIFGNTTGIAYTYANMQLVQMYNFLVGTI